jgi:hypothetical protein
MCHICLCAHGDRPALFSGDTLFNAGAGNWHNGGNAQDLYTTSSSSSRSCPTTRVSSRATTTLRTTCASHSRASRTTRRPGAASTGVAARLDNGAGDDAG